MFRYHHITETSGWLCHSFTIQQCLANDLRLRLDSPIHVCLLGYIRLKSCYGMTSYLAGFYFVFVLGFSWNFHGNWSWWAMEELLGIWNWPWHENLQLEGRDKSLGRQNEMDKIGCRTFLLSSCLRGEQNRDLCMWRPLGNIKFTRT